MSRRNLVLIGFMGTGKSTIGRICAARLGFAFRDSDRVIEQRTGCSIPELFAAKGEAAFRQLEREVIAELATMPDLVIATGGGAPLEPENAARLRDGGTVVLLTATPDVILKRVGNARSRPILAAAPDPRRRILELLEERAARYAQVAHHRVDTTDRPPKAVAAEIIALFSRQP
jgi:shikimate kinase